MLSTTKVVERNGPKVASLRNDRLCALEFLRMTSCRSVLALLATCWAVCVESAQVVRELEVRRALSELAASTTDSGTTVQSLLEGPPELTTALPLFQQLVREDQRDILRKIGELHLLGDGTMPHNKTRAELFLQASAGYGSAQSQFLLGALKSSSGDDAGAQLYYQFAAHGKSIGAAMAMGYRALHGYGSPKSCETAMHHYKFAADRVVTLQGNQKLQLYALPNPVRLSDNEGARYHTDGNPAEDIHRAEYLRQRAADLSNADVMVQSASITLFSDLYSESDGDDELEEHAFREREALRFLKRSIDLGNIKAQALLGHVYAYGLAGCQPNVTRAVELYEAALDASQVAPSGEAANGLGVIYSRGIGDIPTDPDKARDLFKIAASAGYAEGVYNTGMAFMKMGSYLSSRAKEYFVAAAHVGHLKSTFQLARIKQRQVSSVYSIGTTTNSATCEEVVELYKRVAEHSREGTHLMAIALTHTQRGNWALALELYLIAAEMGYEIAQSNAIWLIDRIQRQVFGSIMNRDASLTGLLFDRLVSRAVAQDSADALVRLGDAAFQDQNYVLALRHYQHADLVSAGNSARALYSVGYMHEHGLGVSLISIDRALLYYQLAGKIEPSIRLVMAMLQFKVNVQHTVNHLFETMSALWITASQSNDEVGGQVAGMPSSESSHGGEEDLDKHPRLFQLAANAVPVINEKLGSTTRSAPVEFAAALQFLGDQSRLHLELNEGDLPLEHQDFTIETWLMINEMPPIDNSAEQAVILVDALDNFQLELLPVKGEDDDDHWVLRFRKYSLVDENLPELVLKFPNAPLATHKWNHVAVTFDAKYQTVTLLLNARVKQVLSFRPHPAAPNRDGDATSEALSSKFLAVGSSLGRIYGIGRHESIIFSGQLVHFRLWKTRKNVREIRVLMMEQYDEVETRDLLIHLRYDVHGLGGSNNEESDSSSPANPIVNGNQPVPGAQGVQFKFVKYPPQDQ
ncbi:Protein sel-1 1 [Phytophthora boehmeriae]|uniref:Protein sel-1 1 n=1 Tax=Phytophthora boehmeriae TaxID=109152 RepID=A0A8T1XFE4_9STRA|nr:Protein sel-1 1 [Phytophthora boehmeriae]